MKSLTLISFTTFFILLVITSSLAGDKDEDKDKGKGKSITENAVDGKDPSCSIRPKPLFWFRSNTNTETQIGWYFRADTVTNTETRFQEKNPVANFSHWLGPIY